MSDSIIRRIIPSKFSPNGKTLKRFVRGGVETCTKYVTDHCSNIVPKNILINIGTRDLRTKEGVTSEAVQKLYETLTKLWPNINIFILPIIRRKDTSEEHIANANKILVTESRNFKNISILDEFHPTDDMFFDNAHLHNKKGLPVLVKHLKFSLNMYPDRESANSSRYRNINQKDLLNNRSMQHMQPQPMNLPPPWYSSHQPPWSQMNNMPRQQWTPPNVMSPPPWSMPNPNLMPPWMWQQTLRKPNQQS